MTWTIVEGPTGAVRQILDQPGSGGQFSVDDLGMVEVDNRAKAVHRCSCNVLKDPAASPGCSDATNAPEPMDDAPRFSNPPVAEVALAVQFDPIPELLAVDLGTVRKAFADAYPLVRQHPPLPPMASGFASPAIRLQLLDAPELPRTWFLSEDESRLVQFQSDRLGVNWRRRSDEPYPHYDNIRPSFVEAWSALTGALAEVGHELPDPTACEVLYLNPIESGEDRGWTDLGQLQNVLAGWSGATSDAFLPEPAEVRIATRYTLPDESGVLEVDASPARQLTTGKTALMLQLRAVGKPLGEGIDGALQFMDLGHDWIVRAFASFTTKDMHKLWGRE